MRQHENQFESGDLSLAARVMAWAARITVLLAVLVAPWLIGAVEAWVQVWLFGAVFVALAFAALHLAWPRSEPVVLSFAILPLILAIGLGAFHLVPLDRDTLGHVSPKARSIAEDFLPSSGSTEQVTAAAFGNDPMPERRPTSVYPTATKRELAMLVLATSVFLLGMLVFHQKTTHLWLCGLVAANGATIAFFGLAQKLTWDGQLYWSIALTQGGAPFGPFINRNNAGGYLILCLAAAIGLVLWCLSDQFGSMSRGSSVDAWRSDNMLDRIKSRAVEITARLDARMLSWMTIASLLVAAICCTLSRGSVLAMLAAGMVTITVLVASKRQGLAILGPLAAMSIGLFLIGWVGLGDEVGTRMATLFDDEAIQQGRIPHWQDGLQAAGDFLRTGSGLGTYRFVYLQYQEHLAESWFHYAENMYLQVLVEGGILGLALFISGLGLVAASVWRLLIRGSDNTTLAFAVTGIFALAGQMTASVFDFGLFIPANFLLFALLCGAFAGSAAQLRASSGGRKSAMSRPVAILLTTGLCAGCFWGQAEIRSAVPAEKAMRDIRAAGRLRELSETELDYHIEQLNIASETRPRDAELHRRLAELWMQRYQLETLADLPAGTSLAADDPQLVQFASPMLVHQRAWLYTRSAVPIGLDTLRQSPIIQTNLKPALEHLVASRQACPLMAEVHCGIAELCALVGPITEDQLHIERARRLAPGNPDLLYVGGQLDFQATRFAPAQAAWKASLALSPRYLAAVLQVAGPGLAEPGVAQRLLPDDPELLVRLAGERYGSVSNKPIREQLLARAEQLLPESDLPEAERLFQQGSISALREAYPEAIDLYTQALAFRPSEVQWQYELARLLLKQGLLDQAHQRARRCARLAPREPKYERLLKEIHNARLTRPVASPGDQGITP